MKNILVMAAKLIDEGMDTDDLDSFHTALDGDSGDSFLNMIAARLRLRKPEAFSWCPLCGTEHEPGEGPAGYSCQAER